MSDRGISFATVNGVALFHAFTLFEYDDVPEIFVSSGSDYNWYLTVHGVDYGVSKWAIAKSDMEHILMLLDKESDVYSVMQRSSEKYLARYGSSGVVSESVSVFKDVDLPKQGEKLLFVDMESVMEDVLAVYEKTVTEIEINGSSDETNGCGIRYMSSETSEKSEESVSFVVGQREYFMSDMASSTLSVPVPTGSSGGSSIYRTQISKGRDAAA